MNRFVRLFKRYGWAVEQLEDNSFIAYNTSFFVPFSCIPFMGNKDEFISTVSYLICDKDEFIKEWRKYNAMIGRIIDIGTYAFKDYFEGNSKFYQFGALANHDHSVFEVEQWLEWIKIQQERN